MTQVFELTKLDPDSFEHMINMLALKVIGNGVTGFGPGPDGGRDGYFEGSAPYPSQTEQWSGTWYIQSKFHRPQLSDDPQKWLIKQITNELEEFGKARTRRVWPKNWIVVTNIEPSGYPQTGAFDTARDLVAKVSPPLAKNFHIWGGRKVLDFLARFPEVYTYYGHFLTPGHILKEMYDGLHDTHAQVTHILRHVLVTQFDEQQHTKLEQAGSTTDNRPGIHQLFTDLPFISAPAGSRGMGAEQLAKTLAYNHRATNSLMDTPNWGTWSRLPNRARIWFIKGGPGQGKSTLAQYICQVQRAALLLQPNGPPINPKQRAVAKQIEESTQEGTLWPLTPRIPLLLELREFAQWYGQRKEQEPRGVTTYVAERLSREIEQTVYPGTLVRMFGLSKWLFVFDGLDEVPGDVKDDVSKEVIKFTNDTLVGCQADAVIVCTSRPQGYSGQLGSLDASVIELSKLSPTQALACAEPVLKIERSVADSSGYYKILKEALNSPAVQEIMTTPLQAHIMAVVVRDGGKPPERKWQLFTRFYAVIKQREANRSLAKPPLARLLQEGDVLLKAIHNRLGFELHKRAETKAGANTFLTRDEFRVIAKQTVEQLQEDSIDETVSTLMEATTDRLVLVNTPENGSQVRFDVRPLQEFFSAEYLYENVSSEKFSSRIRLITDDSHWREVMHFLLSALVENGRQAELSIAVQVLAEANGSASDESVRLVSRRLAIGSLIASRLLEEGVLDRDKRVRNQFNDCIEPLLGSSEYLENLIDSNGVHTKTWLTSLLIRQLSEKTRSENLGAVAALLSTVPDGNAFIDDIHKYVHMSPPDYKVALFTILSERDTEAHGPLANWVVKLLIESKLDSSWFVLGRDGNHSVDTLLIENRETIPKVASEFGVSGAAVELWSALLVDRSLDYHRSASDLKSLERPFGLFEARCFNPRPELDYRNFSDETWNMLEASTGYLQVCSRIFRLAANPNQDNLEKLQTLVGLDRCVLELVHDDTFSWIPSVYHSTLRCSGEWRARWPVLTGHESGVTCQMEIRRSADSGEQRWDEFLEQMPVLAIHMILDRVPSANSYAGNRLLQDKTNQIALIKGMEANPSSTASLAGHWGKLLSCMPDIEDRLRGAIRQCSVDPCRTFFFGAEIHPFPLQFPDEAHLLPHVLNHISECVLFGRQPATASPSDAVEVFSAERQASVYVAEPESLIGILNDSNQTVDVRGASLLMYVLHSDADQERSAALMQIIPDFCRTRNSYWYPRSAAIALQKKIASREVAAMSALAQLFDEIRDDFAARLTVQPVIDIWRQSSRAPVTKTANDPIWSY